MSPNVYGLNIKRTNCIELAINMFEFVPLGAASGEKIDLAEPLNCMKHEVHDFRAWGDRQCVSLSSLIEQVICHDELFKVHG